MSKFCHKCGIPLTEENQYPSNKKYRKKICKEGQKEETKNIKIKKRRKKICVIC